MSTILRRGALAATPALLLLLGACSSDLQVDAEEQQIDADVAQYVADATVDDIVMMTAEADMVMQPGFGQPAPADCQRQLLRFRCQPRNFLGDVQLTITRDVTFYDVDGNEQDGYDALETASINFFMVLEGSREREGLSATVSRERDFTVSGLLGEETERIWNGTGEAATNRIRTSDQFGTREYDMTASTVVEDVTIAVPREGTWPLSGTITREVTVEVVNGMGDTFTRHRTVVITFDGTQFASITINGESFTLDLATREVIRDSA